ncbi:MAG: M20 metallopeptidase family protein [Fusobacteriaceae bacterium]
MNEFLKNTREDLHKIPELSEKEFKTAEYIRNMLDSFGIEYVKIDTSTVACIKGESDTWVALRSDIDALPMEEENNADYKSNHKGFMHSCGHDGHMTNLLYTSKWLSEELKKGLKLKKSVMLIFQANEEGTGGAEVIVNHKVFKDKNIEAIFGMHLFPELEEGFVTTLPGVMSSQNISLDITIHGKGTHGAQPYRGIDSILVGAKLVEAYQSIVSRNVPTEDAIIITVGAFHGGTVRNIIPEKVDLLVSVRVFSKDMINFVRERLEAIHKGLEISYGVKIESKFMIGYPSVINDEKLYELFLRTVPKEKISKGARLGGSEDFSYYTESGVPGLFFGLGTRNNDKNFVAPLHSPKFDFNPDALELSFEIFKNLLKNLNVY